MGRQSWKYLGKSRANCVVVGVMGWLVFLFVVVPVVELALLIRLGGLIGLGPTLAMILLTGIIGANLAKQQGLSVLRRFQAETQAGRLPGDALVDGAIILFSGALLLTPGIVTDIVGFLGLLPPARAALKRAVRASLARAIQRGDVKVETFVVGTPPGPPYAGPYRRPAADDGRHPLGPRPTPGDGPIIDVTPEPANPPPNQPPNQPQNQPPTQTERE